MYKLLLIDDKLNVVEGIRRFGNWAERGVEVVGVAANGQDALRLVVETRPDVALTDINMPLLDGLGFIEEALKIAPALKIIVLSGYDQFDYARRALQLGVLDYLLKPVKIDQIVAAVEKACLKLDSERQSSTELDVLRRRQRLGERRQEILALLQNAPGWSERLLQLSPAELAEMGLQINPSGYRIAVFQPATDGYRTADALLELMGETGFVLPDANGKTGVIMVSGDRTEPVLQKLQELQPDAFIAVSGLCQPLNDLTVAYAQALNALSRGFFVDESEDGQLVWAEKLPPAPSQTNYPSRLEREILVSVKAGAESQTGQLAHGFYEALAKTTRDAGYCRAASLELLAVAVRTLHEAGVEVEPAVNYAARIEACQKLSELRELITHVLMGYAQQVSEQHGGKHKTPVERATEFIRANLHREISLDDVASHLSFTSGYLAHIFKKATGQTVVEYIYRLKMERAAELLCDPDAKIASIAGALGYGDRRYFSELFRRHFNCTPSQYREKYLASLAR
jgi:two-component system, response regulator YesN